MQSSCGRSCLLLYAALLASGMFADASCAHAQQRQQIVPSTDVVALDDHRVVLPRDLSPVTILIVGFSKASADATTAWEIPVRTKLVRDNVGFYDVAVLASVPGIFHGLVLHAIRGKVPPVLNGRFLPVFTDETNWKQVCGYDLHSPDAAYVLIVDRAGRVLWRTYEPLTETRFKELQERTQLALGR